MEVGKKNLQPDLDGQGVHEAEEPGGFPAGDLEEDGDAQVHEGLEGKAGQSINICLTFFLTIILNYSMIFCKTTLFANLQKRNKIVVSRKPMIFFWIYIKRVPTVLTERLFCVEI